MIKRESGRVLLAAAWAVVLASPHVWGESYTIKDLGSSAISGWGINDNGDVVGDVMMSDGNVRAFRYRGGTIELFQPLPSAMRLLHTQGYAINNTGQVSGAREDSQGRWALWRWETDGSATHLGFLPGGTYG